MNAIILLAGLLAAPAPGAAAEISTVTAVVGQAAVGRRSEFEDPLRAVRNKVRRARRRIKAARLAGDTETAERLEGRLLQAKKEIKRRRARLLSSERGEVPPRYREIKSEIRADLNTVRRARYALKRAVRRSDNREAVRAKTQLQEAKQRLKRQRTLLRRLMRGRNREKDAPYR